MEQSVVRQLAGEPALLDVRSATKIYGGGLLWRDCTVTALQNFNLTIAQSPATITTIAGESGSGKTTLANAILGFTRLTSGQILYRGNDVSRLNCQQRLEYRREVQAIFQDPYEVYNPFYRVRHVFDVIIRHFRLATSRAQAQALIEEALHVVGMRAEEVLEKYPHQLSGGQRQRLMIARALLLRPRLIVADEPVSMVDASLRAMILSIMLRLREEYNMSFLYITHDLSTAYQVSDRLYILYRGITVEKGPTARVIEDPRHPYVQLLISSIPAPDPSQRWTGPFVYRSEDQDHAAFRRGCRFYDRCPFHWGRCLAAPPPLYSIDDTTHEVACYRWDTTVTSHPAGTRQ